MFSVGAKKKILFRSHWQGSLSEYVTAVDWSPDGLLAASSAAGEVVVWQDGSLINLLDWLDCCKYSLSYKREARDADYLKLELL